MKTVLDRIDEELARTSDPIRRSELLADRGCYVARLGDVSLARETVRQLRSEPSAIHDERTAVRILLLEGVVMFFENLRPDSRDRILRGLAIARAAKHLDLIRLCSAWLAHVDFNLERYDDTLSSLVNCLSTVPQELDSATVRANLVLGDFNMIAARTKQARHCYELARRGAVELGDEATIGAIIFNRATLGLNASRIARELGVDVQFEDSMLALEAQSATLFHAAAHHTSLLQLIDVMNARLLFNQGKFDQAADAYEVVLRSERPTSVLIDSRISEFEYAACLVALGRDNDARSVVASIPSVTTSTYSIDDRLIISGLRCRLHEAFGDVSALDLERSNFQSLREGYEASVLHWGNRLQEIESQFFRKVR